MGLDLSQPRDQAIVAILPKISALSSLFCGIWIVYEVLTDDDRKRGVKKHENVYNRLLMMMSLYDILYSIWNFASTWPVPVGTPFVYEPIGTQGTCVAQGFFLQFAGIAVPLYNAFLSMYYLMVIRFNVSENTLRKYVEPSMHAFAFIFAIGTGVAGLVLKLYNFATLWCWIAHYPLECNDSRGLGSDHANCERGDNAWIYTYAFYFCPIWSCIIFACVSMYMVYAAVRKKDAETLKYRRPELMFGSISAVDRERRQEVHRDFSIAGDDEEEGVGSGDTAAGRTRAAGLSVLFRDSLSFQSSLLSRSHGRGRDSLSSSLFSEKSRNSDSNLQDSHTNVTLSSGYTNVMPNQSEQHDAEGFERASHSQADPVNDIFGPDQRRQQHHHHQQQHHRHLDVVDTIRVWQHLRRKARKDLQKSQDVYEQAAYYLGIFLFTHFFSTANRAVQLATGNTYFPLTVIHSFVDPFQGTLNFLVWRRPRYLAHRRRKVPRLKALWIALGLFKDKPGKGNPSSSKFSREASSSPDHSKEMCPHSPTSSLTSCISGICSRFSGFTATVVSTVDMARASGIVDKEDDTTEEPWERNDSFNKGSPAMRNEQKCEEAMVLPGGDCFDEALELKCREGPETIMQSLGDVLDVIAEEATDDDFDKDMKGESHDSDGTDYDPQEAIKSDILIDHAVKRRIGRSPGNPDIKYQLYSQDNWDENDVEMWNRVNPFQEPDLDCYGGDVTSPAVALGRNQEFFSQRIYF